MFILIEFLVFVVKNSNGLIWKTTKNDVKFRAAICYL